MTASTFALVQILLAATAPAPSVSEIYPAAEERGQAINIRGANFGRVVEVRFGDFVAPIQGSTGSTIALKVPEIPAGQHTVRVVLDNGTVQAPTAFRVFVVPEPSPAPNPPADGDPALYLDCPIRPAAMGTTRPRIDGIAGQQPWRIGTTDAFTGAAMNGATIKFSGARAGIVAEITTPAAQGDYVGFRVPAGARSGPVCVTTAAGNASYAARILHPTVEQVPQMTEPGLEVALRGRFLDTATEVRLGGVVTPIVGTIPGGPSMLATVRVRIPNGAQSGYFRVKTPWGDVWKAQNVRVGPCLPTVSSAPTSGATRSTLRVRGRCLIRPEGPTDVRFGTVRVATGVGGTGDDLQVSIPDAATSGPLTITTPVGTAILPFSITPPSPRVDSVSPTRGTPGTTVTFRGRDVRHVSRLSIGDVEIPIVRRDRIDGDDVIVARLPDAAGGAVAFEGTGVARTTTAVQITIVRP